MLSRMQIHLSRAVGAAAFDDGQRAVHVGIDADSPIGARIAGTEHLPVSVAVAGEASEAPRRRAGERGQPILLELLSFQGGLSPNPNPDIVGGGASRRGAEGSEGEGEVAREGEKEGKGIMVRLISLV